MDGQVETRNGIFWSTFCVASLSHASVETRAVMDDEGKGRNDGSGTQSRGRALNLETVIRHLDDARIARHSIDDRPASGAEDAVGDLTRRRAGSPSSPKSQHRHKDLEAAPFLSFNSKVDELGVDRTSPRLRPARSNANKPRKRRSTAVDAFGSRQVVVARGFYLFLPVFTRRRPG